MTQLKQTSCDFVTGLIREYPRNDFNLIEVEVAGEREYEIRGGISVFSP